MIAAVTVTRPGGALMSFAVPLDDLDLACRLIYRAASSGVIPHDSTWHGAIVTDHVHPQEVRPDVHDTRPQPTHV